jgi:trimeric autotransporter adhesin
VFLRIQIILAPTSIPPNLKINETIATQLESGGTPIAGITTDFEGDTRNATTPDIGADEFNGIGADLTAPSIVYTSLSNTSILTNITVTATITDPSGVQTGTNGPRIYFKKNLGGTYLFDSNPTVSGDDYTFTIDHVTLGLAIGDTVYYYFAAQDLAGNGGTNPGGGSGVNPPGTTPPGSPDFYQIVAAPLAGDYTVGLALFKQLSGLDLSFEKRIRTIEVVETIVDPVAEEQIGIYEETVNGTITIQEPASEEALTPVTVTRTIEQEYYAPVISGQDYEGSLYYEFTAEQIAEFNLGTEGIYPTITSAIADANLRGVGGAVRFLLVDATYPSETFPIVIGSVNGVSSTNTITFSPATGVTTSISGTTNTPIFDLSGASYIIFDGRANGVGDERNMTVENLSTVSGSHTFRFIDGSTYNTIRYTNVINSSQGTAGPRAIDMATSITNPSGNSFNTIENCYIQGGRTGIGFAGTTANPNTDNVIASNIFANFSYAGIWFSSNAANTTVEGNEFYHTELYNVQAMAITVGASATLGVTNIVGNHFYDLQNSTTSTLRVISGTPGTLSTMNIVNNFFSLMQDNGTKTSIYAVQISGTTEYTVNAYYNTFRLGGVHTGGTAGVLVSGGLIKSNTGSASTFNAKNNIGINTRTGGTAGVIHTNFFAGTTALVGTFDIDYNVWYAAGDPGSYSAGWGGFVYNDQQAYRDSATPNEQHTIFKNVEFVSNTDLHLAGSSIGDQDLGGIPIAGITTDIDGDLRDPEIPYRGADESESLNIPPYLVIWERSVSQSNLPTWFGADTERGLSLWIHKQMELMLRTTEYLL